MNRKLRDCTWLALAGICCWVVPLVSAAGVPETLGELETGWENPARTYRPHTRWWWPGNVLTKADITWQLEQMKGQGIGGVEISNPWRMYEKGDVDYLSPHFFELLRFTVGEAKRLDMDVAITMGAGWVFGGSWVPLEDQSKVLGMASRELVGGTRMAGPVPVFTVPADSRNVEAPNHPADPGKLIAVVAARVTASGGLDADSCVVLTPKLMADGVSLDWSVPAGNWRLMAFWLKHTWQINHAQSFEPPPMVIDHLNKGAVTRYLDHLGGLFYQAVGPDFGRTVDSFFCDSFEVSAPAGTLLWSTDTLDLFRQDMGYDLTKYLPALWFDIGSLTPRVRYDLGKFLSDLALKNFFAPFDEWCAAHHTQARIQPHYRFTEELIQGSGASQRPETELTTARFEPVVEPRKATASGARFYGREIVSAEAYTFLHMSRYRTNLQELKIASDAFLRDGVTQFYNAGYFGSPEAQVAPGRDLPWDSNDLNHWSPWWKYYHYLADYVARSCEMLRQGKLVADVLIYTPQDTAWSERAIWGDQIRALPYGDLAKTLVANGYDFDVINDDLLQHHALFHDGGIEINGHLRRILLLPRTTVVPIESMRAIRRFADAGGMVIALEQLPAAAAGLIHFEQNDAELMQIVRDLFSPTAGGGTHGVFLANYRIIPTRYYPGPKPYSSTAPLRSDQRQLLELIGRVVPPDFSLPDKIQSDGLTFVHQRTNGADIYFVTNLEPCDARLDVKFRCHAQSVQRWDPMTGAITAVAVTGDSESTTIPVSLHPWESVFYVFSPDGTPANPKPAKGLQWKVVNVAPIGGPWRMTLSGLGSAVTTLDVATLTSWTERERTQHFSGTGSYETDFTLNENPSPERSQVRLDLGRVGDVAEVEINGKPAGVAWMEPYCLDVTRYVQSGPNHMVVKVANTLINYVTGLKTTPEVPVELQDRLGKANPSVYPGGKLGAFPDSWLYAEFSEKDLPPSGLLGPVWLITSRVR